MKTLHSVYLPCYGSRGLGFSKIEQIFTWYRPYLPIQRPEPRHINFNFGRGIHEHYNYAFSFSQKQMNESIQVFLKIEDL